MKNIPIILYCLLITSCAPAQQFSKIDLTDPCALISHKNYNECFPCGLPQNCWYEPGDVEYYSEDGEYLGKAYQQYGTIVCDNTYFKSCMDSLKISDSEKYNDFMSRQQKYLK